MSLAQKIEQIIRGHVASITRQIVDAIREEFLTTVNVKSVAPEFDGEIVVKKVRKLLKSKTKTAKVKAKPAKKVSTLTPAQLSARRKTLANARAVLAAKRAAAARGTVGHKKKKAKTRKPAAAKTLVPSTNGHNKHENSAAA